MKIILLLLLVSFSEANFAQSSPRFNITRTVITGGGATASTSSRFRLSSTIAQPLAAVPGSTRFSIQGGFWIWPAPILFAPTRAGTNFLVSIESEPGKTYTVQYLNVLGSSWQNLTTVAGNGNVITVTNAALGGTQRFYRLMEQ
jgi:hypothetical protein